jgi:hypothetical protein
MSLPHRAWINDVLMDTMSVSVNTLDSAAFSRNDAPGEVAGVGPAAGE